MERDKLKQYTKELQKPILKRFKRREIITTHINDIWSADLLDVSKFAKDNNNIKFLLVIVDIYSRFAYVRGLKNKAAQSVLEAFEDIKVTPDNLWVDEGKEFYNGIFKKFCKDNNINMYHTYSGLKSMYSERFNRTLRNLLFKYVSENDTNKYIKALPEIVNEYNNTVHKGINMKPIDIYVNKKMYHNNNEYVEETIDLKVGDYVRISNAKQIFEKDYTPKWSFEVYKIIGIDEKQIPYMFIIEDLKKESIVGKFYKQELQKTLLHDFRQSDFV